MHLKYIFINSYVGGADSVADEATRNRPGEVQKEVKIAGGVWRRPVVDRRSQLAAVV